MNKRMRHLFVLIILAFAGGGGLAAKADDAGSAGAFALYSNLCVHQESGDLLGTRIGLLHLGDGTYAMYQESEGWPGQAQIVKLNPDLLKKSRLDFQLVMDGQETVIVRGTIADNALILTSGGLRMNEKVLRLNRVALPEKIHACR